MGEKSTYLKEHFRRLSRTINQVRTNVTILCLVVFGRRIYANHVSARIRIFAFRKGQ